MKVVIFLKVGDVKVQIDQYMKEFDLDHDLIESIEKNNEEVYLDVEDQNDHTDRILVWNSSHGDILVCN